MSSQPSLPIPKSKRGTKGFIAEVRRELTKVTWPTVPETNRLTGIVLSVCLLIGLTLTALSYVSDIIIRLITKGRL